MTEPPKPVLVIISIVALVAIAGAFYIGAVAEMGVMSDHAVTAHAPTPATPPS